MRGRPIPELEIESRYVLLAPLAEDKRVLDVGGDAASLMLLAEAGAAELTAASEQPDTLCAQLVESGIEGIEVVPTPTLPLSFEDGAFDLIICHDLGEWVSQDKGWIAEVRRVLSADGFVAFALANPNGLRLSNLCGKDFSSALSYEEAFAELSETFGVLTVFVQSPMAANLFYDIESTEEETDLVFDRSLLTEDIDEAGWYVLVFGPSSIHRDDLAIVQVPFASMAQAVRSREAEAPLRAAFPDELEVEIEESSAANTASPEDNSAAILQLEQENHDLTARLEKANADVNHAITLHNQAMENLGARDAELRRLQTHVLELENAPVTDEAETSLLHHRIAALKADRQDEHDKLLLLRQRSATLETEHSGLLQSVPLLRARIKALKIERRREKEKIALLRERQNSLQAELEFSQAGILELELELANLRAERDNLIQERDSLAQERDSLAQVRDSLVQVRDRLAQERNSERDRLTQERDAAQQQRDAAVQERGEAQQQRYAATQERDAAHQQRDAAIQERDAAQQQRDTAIQERDAAQQDHDVAAQERDAAHRERDMAAQEWNAATQERDTLRQERDDALQTRDDALRTRDATSRERDEIAKQRDELRQERDDALQTRDDALRTRDATSRERDEIAQQRDKLVAERDSINRQLEELATAKETAARDLEGLAGQKDAIAQERDTVVAELSSTASQRDEIAFELNSVREEISAVTSELDTARRQIEDVGDDRDNSRRELEELREQADRERQDNKRLVSDLAMMQTRVDGLKEERQREQHELGALRQKLLGIETEHQSATGELELARQRIATLKDDRNGEQQKLSNLRGKLTAIEAENAALNELRRELERTQQLVANTDAMIYAERQAAEKANNELQALKQEMEAHVGDRRSFESQIKDLLEEVGQLRQASSDEVEAGNDHLGQDNGELLEALGKEKTRNEELLDELAQIKNRMGGLESENQSLATVIQRLTDEAHERSMGDTPFAPTDETDTVIAKSPLLLGENAAESNEPKQPRDSVGRAIETSLEDIEDLIAGSVPPSPSRR
ncbi:MAG: hypothetical protein A2289_22830 [Deltaproteobacteria bacterium RIFOXYA12_FULL_58_15]|nr:MAG: hypothetical protein A2289_22830 [Deltaproteobacteria bacterium RIFOXYA12_FULL_58_15]